MSDDEYNWKDRDDCSGCVIGYREVRLQQPDVPDDVVALLHVGNPPVPHANGIDSVIHANPVYLTAEQAVDAALVLLDAAARGRNEADGPPQGPVAEGDHDRRQRGWGRRCPMTDRIARSWRIVRDLHRYFRAAEYPMGRVEAWVEAVKMRAKGWP